MSRSQAGQPEALLATRKSARAVLFWRGSVGATRPWRWRPAPRPRGASSIFGVATEHGPHDAPIFAISSGGRRGTVYVARRKKKSPRNQEPSRLSHHCRDYPASPRFSRRRRGRARAAPETPTAGTPDAAENLTVPERTERVEASDLEIKTLGPCRYESPVATRLGQAALHHVGRAERVLLDDRFSRVIAAGYSALPTFELAGPRNRIFFDPTKLRCGIVTCGGLCPGINNVVRGLVLELTHAYGVQGDLRLSLRLRGLVARFGHEPLRLDARAWWPTSTTRAARCSARSRGSQDPGEMVDTLRGAGHRRAVRHRRRRHAARRHQDRRRDRAAQAADRGRRHPQDHRQRHPLHRSQLRLRERVRGGGRGDPQRARRGDRRAQRHRPGQADGPALGLHRLPRRAGRRPTRTSCSSPRCRCSSTASAAFCASLERRLAQRAPRRHRRRRGRRAGPVRGRSERRRAHRRQRQRAPEGHRPRAARPHQRSTSPSAASTSRSSTSTRATRSAASRPRRRTACSAGTWRATPSTRRWPATPRC